MAMLNKRLFVLAFAVQSVTGSFCMMDMAHAADMPMSAESHEAMEMNMTPASPHCEHCEHEDKQEPQGSPCDNGHCLSQSASTTA
jgi:hypothetical protein